MSSGVLRRVVAFSFIIAGCSDEDTFFPGGEVASPDGSFIATFYALGGGGAAGWLSEFVTIRPANTPLPGPWGQFDDGCPGAKIELQQPTADGSQVRQAARGSSTP